MTDIKNKENCAIYIERLAKLNHFNLLVEALNSYLEEIEEAESDTSLKS